jgi:hypothetical protein
MHLLHLWAFVASSRVNLSFTFCDTELLPDTSSLEDQKHNV